ncbi:glycosyltransferase family 39 protein [Flexivirga aerilata]|uniref:glycosyltransferase family 39 protein n=1 Tax=Flexivirga aerilata TaxID=1656889 RepID=UPI001BB1DCF5
MPYDEPSHWTAVNFLLEQHRLPHSGDTGLSYEQQQPPLAYLLAALAGGAGRAVAGVPAEFYTVRLLGGMEFLVAAVFLWRLLGRLALPPLARRVAVATFVLNPVLLAMAWSIQNDSLFLALGFAALDLGCRALQTRSTGAALTAGVVAGAAALAKQNALAVVIAVVIVLLAGPAERRLARAASYLVPLVVICGWWYVYNIVAFGGPLPPRDLGSAPFPARGLPASPHAVLELARGVVTFLWSPTEYWRNVIASPAVIDAAVVAVTAVVLVVGGARVIRRLTAGPLTQPQLAIVMTAAVSIAGWFVTLTWFTAVAARYGYLAWPAWAWLIAALAGDGRTGGRRVVAVALVGFVLLLAGWALWSVHDVSAPAVQIDLG